MTARLLPPEYASWDTLRASMVLPPTRDEILTRITAGWEAEGNEGLDDLTVVPKLGKHVGGYKPGTGKRREKVVHIPNPGEMRFKDFVREQSAKLHKSVWVIQNLIYAGKYVGLNKRREGHACFVMADAILKDANTL
jgi:hypothetical protein